MARRPRQLLLGLSATLALLSASAPAGAAPLPAPAPEPTPQQRLAASDLLGKVRQLTASLDQLDSRYVAAQQSALQATAKSWAARSELDATRQRLRRLERRAARGAVGAYMATTARPSSLEQFSSGQAAAAADVTGVYERLAGHGLARQVARVGALRSERRDASRQAEEQADVARKAAARAEKALGEGRTAEAQLLTLLSTLDPGTRAALDDLQRQGDAAVADLLRTGDLALPAGVGSPPPVLGSALASVAFATAQIGKPYLWGASGPDAFDCSGLVQQAWAAAGVGIPRVAAEQFRSTTRISFADLEPGDLVFFERPVGHVGIYVGGGMMIDAPHSGAEVRLDSIFWTDLAGFGRVRGS